MIHGQTYNARVKEFACWVPDIEATDSEMGMSDEQDNIIGDNGALDAEEGEIRETKEVHEDNVENNHNFSWADDVENIDKDHFVTSPINQPKESQNHMPSETSEAPKGDSKILSKPPGFENFKHQKKNNSHHSFSSCPGAKSSRASKSHSKAFSNHGSMIEALVTQIEMGKVLGYDMEGSTNDLKKLIEGLGAKHDDRKKEILWNLILDFKEGHPSHYIIFGDFNVVRFASERIGMIFNSSSANAFNQFISDGLLWEIPHGGHLFTRINRRGNKLSKLDCFLNTEITTSHMRNHSA
ncbi:RNA-directed DNA polymerase, eukaryota [Tanacetum coccineum]